MKHEQIEELVKKAKDGDIVAEEKLYFSFMPYIKMLVSKFNVKGYSKDDIANECYLALNKAISRYNGNNTFISYVTKCLKNHVLLLLRYSVKMTETTLIDDIFSGKDDIANDIINKLSIRSLKGAIKTLSPKEQKVIEDYFFNDFSLVTISKVIDEKYITTVKIKDRAIAKLRTSIIG